MRQERNARIADRIPEEIRRKLEDLFAERQAEEREEKPKKKEERLPKYLRGSWEVRFTHKDILREGSFCWDRKIGKDVIVVSLSPGSIGQGLVEGAQTAAGKHNWGSLEVEQEPEGIRINLSYRKKGYPSRIPPAERIRRIFDFLFGDEFTILEMRRVEGGEEDES